MLGTIGAVAKIEGRNVMKKCTSTAINWVRVRAPVRSRMNAIWGSYCICSVGDGLMVTSFEVDKPFPSKLSGKTAIAVAVAWRDAWLAVTRGAMAHYTPLSLYLIPMTG